MNTHRSFVRAGSLVVVVAAAVVPGAVACSGNASSTPPANAPPPAAVAPPPPGYATAAPPPGYPGAAPAYATAPPGYAAQQPGYPAAAPTGYPQPQPAPTYAPAPAGYPPPQPAPAGYPPAQPAPTAAASQAPAGPLAPTDPNSLQGILAGLQGALQGTLVAPGALPTDLTEAGLKAEALRVAPGMQPEGSELKQSLSEGQHAVVMLTLQAGKCYTVAGFSPIGGVKDLDLNLLAPPLYMTLAGQDMTHNNMPTIGAAPSPMCPILAFPLQYKLDVFARSGSGQIVVQLYSKTKS